MPKRKKYPNLPNGYGTIRFLGRGRTNPYAVHPPAEETDDNGNYIRPKALCYVDDWYVGFAVLNAYHAGTYHAGDELIFKKHRNRSIDEKYLDDFCKRLIADFTAANHAEIEFKKTEKTFAEIYHDFYEWKYGGKAKKKLSEQSKTSTKVAFKNCISLHNKVFREIRYADLQGCIDACKLKSSSIELMITLIKQMYKYADLYELCDKDYSKQLVSPKNDDEHGIPFSDEELVVLWKNQENSIVEFILIMCYSGYRITAYKTLKVDLNDWYFQGGIKTAAGRDRIVPVHSAIQDLVQRRIDRDGEILLQSTHKFRRDFSKTLIDLGITPHTPHDCRHTFSRLCEKYNVNENDRKRMLGHSFGADITNSIYGHRSLSELKFEIEKIKIPF